MKTILVPVERHDSTNITLSLAVMVAKRLGAAVEGFALRPLPKVALGWEPASVSLVDASDWNDPEAEAAGREAFSSFMAEQGIARAADDSSPVAAEPVWRWCTEPGGGSEFLASYARAFDLTVVGQPPPKGPGGTVTTLEAALFDSGGPILIAPRDKPATLGETVVIVWNGSSETSRTIAFAKPLLRLARRIVLLADDGGLGHLPAGRLVQRRLAQNGIEAELKLLPDGKIRSGEVLLREAAEQGCDLLVKGAYTQSRLRQMIFGGATNHLIAEAEIPVFMAH